MSADFDRIDQAALLQQYGLTSLNPSRWEDVQGEETADLGLDGDGLAGSSKEMDDPLGLRNKLAIPRDMDIHEVTPTLLSSKTFSPSAFLSLHHPDASFQDLRYGVEHLRRNVESKGEEVRILVEREFGRFVGVKGSNDAVYRDMQLDMLADGTDHGTRETREIIKSKSRKVTSHKAETIFLPLLSNALKAQKLKSTAGVFEQSKFLFGLPRNLRMYMRAGKYDAVLRDYNKGLYLRDTRPNQLLPIGSTAGEANPAVDKADGSALSEIQVQARREQQKRVFDKIWSEVEKIMDEMRMRLESGLRNSNGKNVEDIEKNIVILLELKPKEDPVWVYLDSCHYQIMDKLKIVYANQMKNVETVRQEVVRKNFDEYQSANNLRRCVARLTRQQGDAFISKSAGHEEWQAITHLVNRLSTVLMDRLPDFWRIAKGHMEGKYTKHKGQSRRHLGQARTMTIEIIKLYVSCISQFFTLSDVAIASSPNNPTASEPPEFLPQHSNSITTCHFASRVLAEIVETASELEGIGGTLDGERAGSQMEVRNVLKNFVESCRWRFEEAICTTWSKDAKSFFHLEGWNLSATDSSTTTYLECIAAMQRHNATVAWQIAGGSIEAGASKGTVPQVFITKIKNAFFDSLYYLLDGLVHLAFSDDEPLLVSEFDPEGGASRHNDKDARVLLTISNLSHLKTIMLPSFMTKFENMYGISTSADRETLDEVVEQLDKILFDDFIKRKAERLLDITQKGLIQSGIAWAEGPKPTEVRPYLLNNLLSLVHVHSQVNGITPGLVERVLRALLFELGTILLECLRQIPRLGMGGMLRATLEVELLHQTLMQYVTDQATVVLNNIYEAISQAYSRKSSEDELEQELENLKKVLYDCRRATGVEFVCFKPTKL